ncbi:hypothetical protein PpBr36_01381 [Pyricularia pennisetigena]|uniref:hypothetical protein n=1 Tax=Pyricularia pennisetigena TaxID=1578925 RepID=UPI00114E83F9|nr:hypothetical protein PpBr36_01381 [Pyricularia pennisetigena]TLS29085.1 hypothetical protein PpBr36_01381 [Pyricularia pennisetigena]
MLASPVDTEFLGSLLAEASGGATTVGSASAGPGCTTQQFGNTSPQDGPVPPAMLLPNSPLPVLDQGVVSRRDGSSSAAGLAAQDRSAATTPASPAQSNHYHHSHLSGSPIDLPTPSDLPEVITPWARSPSIRIETYTPRLTAPLRLPSDENHQHLTFPQPAEASGRYPSLALTLNYEDWGCSDNEMFVTDSTSSPPLTISTGFIVDKRSHQPQLLQPPTTADLATSNHYSHWPTSIPVFAQDIAPQPHSPAVWQSSGLEGVDVISQRSSPLSPYFGPPTPASPNGFALPTGLMPTSYPSSGLDDHGAAGYGGGGSNSISSSNTNNVFLDPGGGVIYSSQQRQQIAALATPASPHPLPQSQHTTLQGFLQHPNQSQETLMSNFPTLPSNQFPTSPGSNHGDGAARGVHDGQQGQKGDEVAQAGACNEEEDSQDEEEQSEQPYAKLLWRAFMSSPERTMTLQDIYRWFIQNTDKVHSKGWQNSIRHNLSMNHAFTKINPRLGKGSTAGANKSNPDDEGNRRTKVEAASSTAKKLAVWYLQDWAIENGVQSTTRYRTKTQSSSCSRPGGSKGGEGGPGRQQQRNSGRPPSSSSPMAVHHLKPAIGGSRRSNRASSARWSRYSDRMHPYRMPPYHSVQELEARTSPHPGMRSLQSCPSSAIDGRRQQQQQQQQPIMLATRDQWQQFTLHQRQQQPSNIADPTGEIMYGGGPHFCYPQQQQQQQQQQHHHHHHHHLDNMYPISGPPVRTEPLMMTHRPSASYDLPTSLNPAHEVTPQQQQMLQSSEPTTSFVPGLYDGAFHPRQDQQQIHDYQHHREQHQEGSPEIKMEHVAARVHTHRQPFPNRNREITAAATATPPNAAATPSDVEPKPSPRQTGSGGLGGVFFPPAETQGSG